MKKLNQKDLVSVIYLFLIAFKILTDPYTNFNIDCRPIFKLMPGNINLINDFVTVHFNDKNTNMSEKVKKYL